MKSKLTVALAIALTAASSASLTSSVSAQSLSIMSSARQSAPSGDIVKVDRRGNAIGLGIIAGVATAVILSDAARADGHRRYRRGSYCGDLLYRCEDGSRYNCRKYEDRCT